MPPEANASNTPTGGAWTSTQVYVMAVICLLIGTAVGYLLRGSASPEQQTSTSAIGAGSQQTTGAMPQGQPTPEQLKRMADIQAAPLIERLKSEPNNAKLLNEIGNMYYDVQQYQEAISYYESSLKIAPNDSDVRTDMGTAYWYLGNADRAIAEFNTALSIDPNKPSTLMNLGIVKWRGKMDVNGAVSAWEKLLQTNPSFSERSQVESMIANAKKHANVKVGTKTDKPL